MTETPEVPNLKARGEPLTRVDGKLKVTGGAQYAVEIPSSRIAYAALVMSTIARGRITGIDTAQADREPGVLAIMTHLNAPKLPAQPTVKNRVSVTDRALQILQGDQVHYWNQPIGVVVADTLERAQRAARLVQAGVRYAREASQTQLPRRSGASGEKPAPPPKGGPSGGTPAEYARGNLDAGLRAAEVRIDQTYTTPFEHHNPMEMHATTAVWQGPNHLTIYDSTQGIFEVRRKVAVSLGLPKENVRVISHFVGGGFGSKGSVWSHVILAALAAQKVGRPVRLMVTRPQMFGPVGGRPPTEQHLVLGARKDGTLTAIQHDSTSSTSRFDEFIEHTTAPTRALYECPNMVTRERLVRLDTGTPQFQRAPGEATGNFALESAMDELSYALGVDPVALRLKNYAVQDPESGRPWSSKSLRACYEQAATRFGWAQRNPKPGSMRDGNVRIGWGMATSTYPAHVWPASAEVTLLPDGTAQVRAGTQDIGTGTYTVMTQLAAETLGLPIERVHFDLGDTDMPPAGGSGGSTTAASVGSAVRMACVELRQKLAELGSAQLEKMDQKAIAELLARHKLDKLHVKYEAKKGAEHDKHAGRSFGAQLVEVRVDRDLGMVRVSRIVAAFACGRILNEKTARSQYMGGIVWGIGMGLLEDTRYDQKLGRIVNNDLSEYLVPVNLDVPAMDIIFVEENDPHINEIGVKGIGEIGITGTAAAIANAVYHATGKRIRELPITLDKLL